MLAVPVRCTGVGERTPVRTVPAAASAVWIAPMTEPAPSSSASSRRIREPLLSWRSSRRWMTWRMASRIWALEAESTTMSGSRTAETVAMAKAVRVCFNPVFLVSQRVLAEGGHIDVVLDYDLYAQSLGQAFGKRKTGPHRDKVRSDDGAVWVDDAGC